MKLLLLAAVFVLASCNVTDDEWKEYKAKYNKNYSIHDDPIRRKQYVERKKAIEIHNKEYKNGHTTYLMEINHFSDWYVEELKYVLGVPKSHKSSEGSAYKGGKQKLPDSVNLVDQGVVTSVKDQIKCGTSYAFSAAGALEGLMFAKYKNITDLSAQELVDCIKSLHSGCEGGSPQRAFDYVKNRNGIDTEASYPKPVNSVQQTCRANEGKIGITCSGYVNIENEEDLAAALAHEGPASVLFSVDINSFFSYKSGVFDGKCGDRQNHAMLAVGYGKDEHTGKEFWILKNSFSENWGENGYIRVVRNENKCDVGRKGSKPYLL